MRTWLRRIRGAVGMGITWAAAWFAAGLVPRWVVGLDTDAPFPLVFAVLGFIAGETFSSSLPRSHLLALAAPLVRSRWPGERTREHCPTSAARRPRRSSPSATSGSCSKTATSHAASVVARPLRIPHHLPEVPVRVLEIAPVAAPERR